MITRGIPPSDSSLRALTARHRRPRLPVRYHHLQKGSGTESLHPPNPTPPRSPTPIGVIAIPRFRQQRALLGAVSPTPDQKPRVTVSFSVRSGGGGL
ncbi:hypothetical protein AAFF_G00435680 [Aldrovandia affinis]|uniref:Uncharacterized protein n=1 Tax=Aldrovandia affinis TaxID=143900 RepID=A0AAD7S8I4_9TELE|nr:hypothetical protein AAFF_G00435680 [Aldrovandia affinis]